MRWSCTKRLPTQSLTPMVFELDYFRKIWPSIPLLELRLIGCVDLVVHELGSIIRKCTQRLEDYSRLKEESGRLITSHVQGRENILKEQLMLLVDVQLAYINTYHEDLIAFSSSQQNAGAQLLSNQTAVVGPIIKKGHLSIHNLGIIPGGFKNHWFVLIPDSLNWYKDQSERDKRYVLSTCGLRMRTKNVEAGFMSRRNTFILFYQDNKNVYKDYKNLELSCESHEELDSWAAALSRAGKYLDKSTPNLEDKLESEPIVDEMITLDPILENLAEVVENIVDSYMRIVTSTSRDIIPKIIMYLLIVSTKSFIYSELMVQLYASGYQCVLMEGSIREESRNNEIFDTHCLQVGFGDDWKY